MRDFSVPELVRSQSASGTYGSPSEFTGFTFQFCSSAGLAAGEFSAVMGLTPCILRTNLLCAVCIGLLSAEFSTVNTGSGKPMLWKPLCLLSTTEGLATTNYQLT